MQKKKHGREKVNKIEKLIKHRDENGNEYWEARELQKTLNYSKWRSIVNTLD